MAISSCSATLADSDACDLQIKDKYAHRTIQNYRGKLDKMVDQALAAKGGSAVSTVNFPCSASKPFLNRSMQLLQTIEKASKTKTAEDEAWDILNDDKEEDKPKPSALKTAQTAATKKVTGE